MAKLPSKKLRVLKDSFYNKTTDRRTITAKGSLYTREDFCNARSNVFRKMDCA